MRRERLAALRWRHESRERMPGFRALSQGLYWLGHWLRWCATGPGVCRFCGGADVEDGIPTLSGTCGWCWYGQRLDPEAWEAGLAARGRHVRHVGGCHAERDPFEPVPAESGSKDKQSESQENTAAGSAHEAGLGAPFDDEAGP